MNTKKLIFWGIIMILLCYIIQSCVYNKMVIYDPPLAKNAHRIVKGQTNQIEIFEWFGNPYLKADGAKITLYSDSPMGLYRIEEKERLIKLKEYLLETEKKGHHWLGPPPSSIDPDAPEKIAGLQPYSSIDEEHIALLYIELDMTLKCNSTIGLPIGVFSVKSICRQNKLLIFINKNTGIVDEFSYWQEFEAD